MFTKQIEGHYIKLIIIILVLLNPQIAFANEDYNTTMGLILFFIIASPYYLFALIISIISFKNKGKEKLISFLIYLLCLSGIGYAYIYLDGYGFTIHPVDGLFFICVLPFPIIIIIEVIASQTTPKLQEPDYNDSPEQDV